MLDDSGEKMAAKETMQTICNFRDRVKTWYSGVDGAWLSRLSVAEEVEECGRFFSSWGDNVGDPVHVGVLELLEWTERSVTVASFLNASGGKGADILNN